MNTGIVFEGGGGKGAYQIGAWKAIRELGIEPFVTCVSGTSVGALNAALFYKGNLYAAEELWRGIKSEDILHEKIVDDFENGDCLFSQKKLAELIETAIKGNEKSDTCRHCYVTCRYKYRNECKYFRWSDFLDIELKKRILLASSAIPVVFENVNIDGEWFMDGGVNGDNIPVKPLEDEALDSIIVIHLSDKPAAVEKFQGKVIEIFPSRSLGGFIAGTLNFNQQTISERIEMGYTDAKAALVELADFCYASKYCNYIAPTGESVLEKKYTLEQNVSMKDGNKNKKHMETAQTSSLGSLVTKCKSENTIKSKYTEEKEMADFKFTNEEARKEYEGKLNALQKIVEDNAVDSAYLWDATVQKYATKMEKVKKILQMEGINELITAKMFKDIDTFLSRCKDAEFHIALVGAIKAGKSTLINALLGYEYASTKVTPETASLTKFKKGAANYVKVSFYSVQEWDALWKSANDAKATVFLEEYAKLNGDSEKAKWLGQKDQCMECDTKEELVDEIMKWTSSKSVCHYFVKEVEVGLKEFELPEGVVLVDTPGLDDVVEYRSNITRDYIDRANAVLVCVKSDALTGQEMATIYSVFANTRYNPEKVYIIATQVDTLNRPKENWAEQQKEWLKYLKGNGAYNSLKLAENNLVPVSAYLYTLLKQYNDLKDDDEKKWDLDSIVLKFRIRDINENYKGLLDFTHIELLKSKLQREIIQDYKKLLLEDITGSYGLCKESIKETMEKIKKTQEEIISTSQGGIEEIKKKQEEYNAKYQEAEQDKKELDHLIKTLKMATSKRADELENAIKGLAK